MIIGGGVVGMNAAFIAVGMEAEVFVFDKSIDRLRELDIACRDRVDRVRRRSRSRRCCIARTS